MFMSSLLGQLVPFRANSRRCAVSMTRFGKAPRSTAQSSSGPLSPLLASPTMSALKGQPTAQLTALAAPPHHTATAGSRAEQTMRRPMRGSNSRWRRQSDASARWRHNAARRIALDRQLRSPERSGLSAARIAHSLSAFVCTRVM